MCGYIYNIGQRISTAFKPCVTMAWLLLLPKYLAYFDAEVCILDFHLH